ncbi:hypothetical protein NIES4106_57330 (plasmid) [Fischerella sp. NIES-4106]|nr:hypothetical protein NIES4106_57330 [Fischerella sp. NIES-4106]
MHLKDFSLMSPDIQSSDVLKAIETAIPAFDIEEAIANTKTEEKRQRRITYPIVRKRTSKPRKQTDKSA